MIMISLKKTDIKYNVKFYGYWHCGSGLSAGSDVDAVVIKDSSGLPFIPGRTIKGLIKEAIEEILFLEDKWDEYREMFIDVFGNAEDRNYIVDFGLDDKLGKSGNSFFSNVEFPENMKFKIKEEKLQNGLFVQLSNTAIDNEGIALENSLRQIEAVVPVVLCGYIRNVPEAFVDLICKSLKMVKRIGLNRSRGLGRCDMYFVEE